MLVTLAGMKLITFIILSILLCLLSEAAHAESKLIQLEDGTKIVGQLLTLANGSYLIETKSLGTIRVPERQVSKITSINNSNSNPVQSAMSGLAGGQVRNIQQSLLGNADMMVKIMALQSSPEVKAILSDPAIMSAIQSFDLESLRENPKIQNLMNNKEVKSITGAGN
ncbi:MAG: hypothetical protein ACI9FB_002220 [Candidatus Azotimanducaceae bacterium]